MVAAGAEHTAAVTEDGDLYGWGWGRYGNLGLGDRNDRLFPEKVSAVDVRQCYYCIFPFAYIYICLATLCIYLASYHGRKTANR